MTDALLLIVAFVLLVLGAEYFTNAVEWLGRRLHMSESATGSLLAAVGTAIPETLVPIVAIFFSSAEASHEIGIGGILGAPFMLSTLAMIVIAGALWTFRAKRQTSRLHFNADTARNDLTFFLIAFGLAFIAGFLPPRLDPVRWAIAFGLIPLYIVYMRRLLKTEPEDKEEEELAPLRLVSQLRWLLPFEKAHDPGLGSILVQVLFSLALIVGGAKLFVGEVEVIAAAVGIPALVLSLLITPVATELPEKLNSVIWINRKKDTLAFGNMSGALVFQSAFPVTVGILFTDWSLSLRPGDPSFLAGLCCVLALISGANLLFWARRSDTLPVTPLLMSGSLYFVFLGAVLLMPLFGAGGAH